jgi:hypothetical protein
MFGIELLRHGSILGRETAITGTLEDAIAIALERTRSIRSIHPERAADSFRVTDASGKLLGVYELDRAADAD